MPLYPYRCPECALEFEVSRKMSESSKPANCPMDGATGTRIFTAPVTLNSRGVDSPPAARSTEAPKPAGYNHFGHSHGFGVGGHAHGARRPPPAQPQ